MIFNPNAPCPCSSGVLLSGCCLPVIENQSANSAEQLMRSRYTAYSLQRAKYIVDTYAPSVRHLISEQDIAQHAGATQWIKLEILDSNREQVEFKAFYFTGKHVEVLHERSNFIWQDGKVFYQDGIVYPYKSIEIGRNSHCLCGSGIKFKRCCMAD